MGLLFALGFVDRLLSDVLNPILGRSTGLLLSGTLFAVIYGCAVRFFAVGYTPLEAGFRKIRPSFEDVARTLGATPRRILRVIHLPLLRGSVLSAGLLVFVDVMKELPATLVMRPFNFDTLAVQAYTLAMDERLTEASTASLAIVAVGLIPVILASRAITRPQRPAPAGSK